MLRRGLLNEAFQSIKVLAGGMHRALYIGLGAGTELVADDRLMRSRHWWLLDLR